MTGVASNRTSAGEVRGALARLRAAGATLRARPASATLDSLARLLDTWRDPESKARRSLDSALPEATGFTLEVVRAGLSHALDGTGGSDGSGWSGAALRALVTHELGGLDALEGRGMPRALGPEVTSVLLAGALPTPTLQSILAPLVLRSPVLARTSSSDPVTARVVAASLAEADPLLGNCLEVVSFPTGDGAAMDAFLAADCVVATGSDETVARVAERVRPPRQLVAHGHRVSVAAIGPEALRGPGRADVCNRLAFDVALWDQLGCLSPVSVWAVTTESGLVDRLAEDLARALAETQTRLPRGRVPIEAAAARARERAEAEMRAADGRHVLVYGGGAGDAWCVVREDDAAIRPAPLHRFVRVHPVPDSDALADALRPLGTRSHLAAVALEGFGPDATRVEAGLLALGASRTCRPGSMQSPPLDWRRDGRGVLTPFLAPGRASGA